MKEYVYNIFMDNKLTIKFGIIGGVGFVSNYLVLKGGVAIWGLDRITAELLAALVALQVTFILHDRWTYRIDMNTHKYHLNFMKRYRVYLVSNSFASLLTVAFFGLFSIFLSHLPALALAAVVGLVWNYLFNKKIIWDHKPHKQAQI